MDPLLWLVVAGAAGLVVGSFINVIGSRIQPLIENEWRESVREWAAERGETVPQPGPRPDGLAWPGSRCPGCEMPIAWYDNVPLLSWFVLRGRCRACHEPISPVYPLVELVMGGLGVAAVAHFGPGWMAIATFIALALLLAATVIDLRTMLLPDSVTMPLLWLGLVVAATGVGEVGPAQSIGAAAAGYAALWLVYEGFRLLTGKEGMGLGDFKLLAAIGAWTGWSGLPVATLVAATSGSVIGLLLIALSGCPRTTAIPFGPSLALGGLVALFWADPLISLYIEWARLG